MEYELACPRCGAESGFPLNDRHEADAERSQMGETVCSNCGRRGRVAVVPVQL